MFSAQKKITLVIFILLSFLYATSIAQTKNIAPLVEAWSKSDTSQTHAAEATYRTLKIAKDSLKYKRNIHDLYVFLKEQPDSRLKARITIYRILGKYEYNSSITKADHLEVEEAIKIANELDDDQLTAEVYTIKAKLNEENNYLLYNLKAIELQNRIGFNHFCYVHNRFFGVSLALYKTTDYKQSIVYGLQCLALKNTDIKNWDPRVYIFQLDIIGAAYKQLGNLDSSQYYYQKILDTLQTKPDKMPSLQKLWLGIAKGNIGHILAIRNNYEQATPLIQEHLQSSLELGSWNNAAIAQNALCGVYFKQKKYAAALSGWKKAYKWSQQSESLDNAIIASKGMADTYRISGNVDSAFFYFKVYIKHKDSLSTHINRWRLSAVSAQITFDNTLAHLNDTKTILVRERIIKKFILFASILIIIIAVLFYNRQRLKEKHSAEIVERKRRISEKEAEEAKEKISLFASRIVEKDKLINNLNEALVTKINGTQNDDFTTNLLEYTLVTDVEWEKFRMEFSKAYPAFLPKLKMQLQHISPAEERLASLIFLHLTNQQIANMIGISKDSVARSKRRLKHRFTKPLQIPLEDYLTSILLK